MLYAAYGSNMNLDQMENRCPNSKLIGTGHIEGWKLVFNIHADIIETENFDSITPVVLWDIADDDWAMLDMYEGFPNYYVKRKISAYSNGIEHDCIVYVMAEDKKGICPPTQYYFDGIIEGCKSNGIDTEYLYDALEYSAMNETEYNQYYQR